jgi:dTDP-4-dehydrorhamnose reductase
LTETTSKVLVIGGRGNLGRQLLEDLPKAIGTSRSGNDKLEALDITNSQQAKDVVARIRPDWVINTAAMTSVDGCERDPEAALSIHVEGTANVVGACEAVGSGLIQLSTNYVFDGSDGPYGEEDSPNPLSVYGSTKLESERLVLDSACPGTVVRTAVFYGSESDRPNFLTWALRELAEGKTIRIVTDEWANPTFIPELSASIVDLVSGSQEGIFHIAGRDFLTRFEMVIAVCEQFGLSPDLVTPVVSSDLGQDAARPPRAGLKIDRIRTIFGRSYESFRDNLASLAGQLGCLDRWLSATP